MIIVSGCLLGIPCKYNGGTNLSRKVKAFVADKSYVMVCPETMAGLPSPRPPAEIVAGKVKNAFGEDLTEVFQCGAQKAWNLASEKASERGEEITLAILKARSPSCGSGRIYDGTFAGVTTDGDGVFAALLKERGIRVITEEEIDSYLEEISAAEAVEPVDPTEIQGTSEAAESAQTTEGSTATDATTQSEIM